MQCEKVNVNTARSILKICMLPINAVIGSINHILFYLVGS